MLSGIKRRIDSTHAFRIKIKEVTFGQVGGRNVNLVRMVFWGLNLLKISFYAILINFGLNFGNKTPFR